MTQDREAVGGAVGLARGGARLRPRAVIFALALVPINVFLVVRGNWTGYGFAAQSMVAPAVAGLFALAGLNRLLRRWALSSGELLAVYVALAISTGLCASVYDWGGNIASVITWPVWNATPGNRWGEFLLPNLPTWLLVNDGDALGAFFLGGTSPYQGSILLGWLQPALWWTAWAAALLWVSLCLNVIVRRRWSQEEQLPFPMTILPVQLIQERAGIFRNSLFWAGVVIAAFIGINQAVTRVAPSLPVIPVSLDYSAWVSNNKPWDAIRIPHLSWQPWQVGLCYLMPADLAFSLIVFNLLWHAEYVISRHLGWSVDSWSGFPFGEQQVMGGCFALITVFLFLERRYFVQVLRKVLGLSSHADDSEEAFSYRAAVLGALLGMSFIWFFLARARMTNGVIAVFLIGYFSIVMLMGRLRAQLGPPSNEMWGAMPDYALTQWPGSQALEPRSLAMFGLLRPYLREQTANPTPTQLEALRMAQVLGVRPRDLALLMVAVVPLGMLSYFWASVHMGSSLGLGSGKVGGGMIFHTRISFSFMEDWLLRPEPPNWNGVGAVGAGFAITALLMALKLSFPAWPLHPVAFPLGLDMTVDDLLPALVIAWIAKSLLMRYGGLRAHRIALPFFLGLISGAGAMSVLRAGLAALTGVPL